MITDQYFVTKKFHHQAEERDNLELFKNLLQPHFLFNSLNNLYALSLRQSEQTPEAIAGLSQLLERVVKYSRMDRIYLSEEIELIQDYIALERIWLGECAFLVDLQVKGETHSIQIPPLTIYTLIENAFKHGIRKNKGLNWITIHVVIKKQKLLLKIRNAVDQEYLKEKIPGEENAGLGIEAVKRLLDSSYKRSYYLDARSIGNVYAVDLIIGQVAA